MLFHTQKLLEATQVGCILTANPLYSQRWLPTPNRAPPNLSQKDPLLLELSKSLDTSPHNH